MSQEFLRVEKVALQYQPLIPATAVNKSRMRQQACSNDESTVDHWRPTWLKQIKQNKEYFGSFAEHSISQLYRVGEFTPCIVAGSGPSLKYNAHELKNRNGLTLISCLHNFHYFEDLDLEPEYYVSLDAGDIVLKEVSEGGKLSADEYWAKTKNRTLVAYVGSNPELFEKWQGEVYLFNAPTPDNKLNDEIEKIEMFRHYISSGGNVLGACLYLAKAIFGCRTTAFIGADFSFGYPDIDDKGDPHHSFHSWKSSYDKDMGATVRVNDLFGNKIHSWPSYLNFSAFFNWVSQAVPGEYINATEGGVMGATNDGNIDSFKYMSLKDTIHHLTMHRDLDESMADPEFKIRKILY